MTKPTPDQWSDAYEKDLQSKCDAHMTRQPQCRIEFSRPEDGINAGLILLKFYKGDELIDVQGFESSRKARESCIFHGMPKTTRINWTLIGSRFPNGWTVGPVYIDNPDQVIWQLDVKS